MHWGTGLNGAGGAAVPVSRAPVIIVRTNQGSGTDLCE